MKASRTRRWGLLFGLTLWGIAPGVPLHADDMPAFSLRAVESRALLAQALTRQVEELRELLASLRAELAQRDQQIERLRDTLDESRAVESRLREELETRDHERHRHERLMALFRSGAFEYYQVRDGDTLKDIAANPMVYDDAERAIWIGHANGVPLDEPLIPGMVLIIPRFSEGVSYDF